MILLAPVLAAVLAAQPATPGPAPMKKALTLEKASEARMPVTYTWRDATRFVWVESERARGTGCALADRRGDREEGRSSSMRPP